MAKGGHKKRKALEGPQCKGNREPENTGKKIEAKGGDKETEARRRRTRNGRRRSRDKELI